MSSAPQQITSTRRLQFCIHSPEPALWTETMLLAMDPHETHSPQSLTDGARVRQELTYGARTSTAARGVESFQLLIYAAGDLTPCVPAVNTGRHGLADIPNS